MGDMTWGLGITVLGMGLVFGLLMALWGLLVLIQRLDAQPEAATEAALPAPAVDAGAEAEAQTADDAPPPRPLVQGMDPELVAAILVAVQQYSALRRREAAPEMRIYWPGSLLYASRWVGAGRSRQNQSWQRRGK